MRSPLLVVLVASLVPVGAPLAQAIEHSVHRFSGIGGDPVVVNVFTIDPAIARIQVVSASPRTPASLDSNRTPQGIFGLEQYAEARVPGFRSARNRLIIAGGNILSAPDTPLGWLVSNGKELSPLDTQTVSAGRAANDAGCRTKIAATSHYRFSGVLCIDGSNGTPVSILLSSQVRQRDPKPVCKQAIQGGPIVIHPVDRQNGICESEPDDLRNAGPAVRIVACVDRRKRLRIALTETRTYLLPLARWLRDAPEMECEAALNLIGDYYAAAIYRDARGRKVSFGNVHVPQASVLVAAAR